MICQATGEGVPYTIVSTTSEPMFGYLGNSYVKAYRQTPTFFNPIKNYISKHIVLKYFSALYLFAYI